jgi:hypothetical protein
MNTKYIGSKTIDCDLFLSCAASSPLAKSDFAGLQPHPSRMSLRCFHHDCLYDKHRSAATRPSVYVTSTSYRRFHECSSGRSRRVTWPTASTCNAALAIPVAAGDFVEIKAVNPNWGTNPLTTIFGGYLYIE